MFWPGILHVAGFNLPTKVHVHGFLTVGGEKMSKSKGTFVLASTYLKHLDPAYLRYYFATKLGPRLDDLDLEPEEFVTKVNTDLVGKVVNLASRTAKFVEDTGLSASYPDDGGLFAYGAALGDEIAQAYENCDYNKAMRLVIELADRANPYVENAAPWVLKKDPAKAAQLQDVCTVALNLFRQIAIYLAPVLPRLARQTGELLNDPIGPGDWYKAATPLVGTPVNKFQHLMKRAELKQVLAMIEDSKPAEPAGPQTTEKAAKTMSEASNPEGITPETEQTAGEGTPSPYNDGPEALEKEPLTAEHCTIDDFMKVDMRVARVIAASHVEGADKLLQLTLSLGGDERRNVFAGIKSVYQPEDLIGQLVICCANLAPRKMRFGTSEGMVLAAGAGGKDIYILRPDSGAKPGMRVH